VACEARAARETPGEPLPADAKASWHTIVESSLAGRRLDAVQER
jgi:hypothetical protein